MEACLNGHAEVVDTLLQHGTCVDLKKEVNLLAIICNKCSLLYLILQYILCILDNHPCLRGVEEVHNSSISIPPVYP